MAAVAKARRQRIPGFAAHDDGAACGGLPEVGHVLRQMPRQRAFAAYDAAARLRPDQAQAGRPGLGLGLGIGFGAHTATGALMAGWGW